MGTVCLQFILVKIALGNCMENYCNQIIPYVISFWLILNSYKISFLFVNKELFVN